MNREHRPDNFPQLYEPNRGCELEDFEEILRDSLLFRNLPKPREKNTLWEDRPRDTSPPIRPISYGSELSAHTYKDFKSTIAGKVDFLNSIARRFSLDPNLRIHVDWDSTEFYYNKSISIANEFECTEQSDRIMWYIANMYPALEANSGKRRTIGDHNVSTPGREQDNQEDDMTDKYSNIVKSIKRVHEKKVRDVTNRIQWLLERGVLKDPQYYEELLTYLNNWMKKQKISGKYYFLQPELALLERYLVNATNLRTPGRFILKIFDEFGNTDRLFESIFKDTNRNRKKDRERMVKSINNNYNDTKKYSDKEIVSIH